MFFANGLCMRRVTLDFLEGHQGQRIEMERPSICSFAMAAIIGIAAGAASAAEPNITAFYGKFQGGATAENDASIYFGVTARDFNVTIGPAGNGFSVEWTSVIRGGGEKVRQVKGRLVKVVRRFMRPAGSYPTRPPVPPSPRPVTGVSIPC